MTEFIVTMTTTASFAVVVEAEDRQEAEEKAWNIARFPYFPGGMSGDLGDWETDSIEETKA